MSVSTRPADPRAAADHAAADDEATLAAFEDSLFTLFDQPIIAHSAPPGQALYAFSHAALAAPLALALPAPPAGLNSLQAQYVWPSSLFLAHVLLSAAGGVALAKGQMVVELGAGCGLAGLTAALCLEKAGGGTVVSTDWGDAAILGTLEANYRRHVAPGSPVRWAVAGHKWGDDVGPIRAALAASADALSGAAAAAPQAQVDHLLLCDLLYYSAAHAALLASVLALLRPPPDPDLSSPSSSSPPPPAGQAHIAAGLHGGTSSAVDRFVALAERAGCTVVAHGIRSWDARNDVWRVVDPDREELTEGMVWWGTLTVGPERR